MLKSFRYLWQFIWVNLAVLLGFAAVLTAAMILSGGGFGRDTLFTQYFKMFPLMQIMIVFMLAFSVCTTNLNLALSFGARRTDYFWAIQGGILAYTLVCWGLQRVICAIPVVFGWSDLRAWEMILTMGRQPWWVYPLACMASLALGCLCGMYSIKSRVIGGIIMLATIAGGVGATVGLLFTAEHLTTGRWGMLPHFLAAGMTAVFLASEYFVWRAVRRTVVK